MDESWSKEPVLIYRPPYRPPIGMPVAREDRWRGPLASILLHALIVLLLLMPVLLTNPEFLDEQAEGGGAGPAGGGGGGSGGTGGSPRRIEESIRYIEVAPVQDPILPPIEPVVVPPVIPPVVPPPEPVVPPPQPVVETPPPPVIPEVKPEPTPPAPTTPASLVAGTGGGSGNDGTMGNGPGSGGGIGSGIGTGRGSGTGPGTGGGAGDSHSPSVTQLFVPPMPIPDKLKGDTIVVQFDVDEKGRVIKFTFNEPKDRDYNRRMKAMLNEMRFRPATTLEGVPIRATAIVKFVL